MCNADLDPIRNVLTWRRGDQRAPHKPLLLLLQIARISRGESRLAPYSWIHDRLESLLREFGPSRRSLHPEYPFWRLQKDGEFWDIPERAQAEAALAERKRRSDCPPTILRSVDAHGGFTEAVDRHLRSSPEQLQTLAAEILDEHFPSSLHDSLLNAVGMAWQAIAVPRRARSPQFRESLVRIYEHRCAICSFDGRVGYADLALEAAHIQWHSYGGPDEPSNGLLLCALHHRALDRGAISLSDERRVVVSQHLHGGAVVNDMLLRFNGQPIRVPIEPQASVSLRSIRWHQREVFRSPERSLS